MYGSMYASLSGVMYASLSGVMQIDCDNRSVWCMMYAYPYE